MLLVGNYLTKKLKMEIELRKIWRDGGNSVTPHFLKFQVFLINISKVMG